MEVKPRREQYSEATRSALLDSARRLFREKGYAATSIEDIVSAARVTRGAFYHHFEAKQAVFEQAFALVHQDLSDRILARMGEVEDLWSAAVAGLDAFLDACLDEEYQRIALQEAPVALGWSRWRELDELHAFGLVRDSVEAMHDAGLISTGSVDICARVLFAAFAEAAIAIAASPDQIAAKEHARGLLMRILEGLRAD